MEKTLIILKPDAVKRKLVGEILSRFEKKNLSIQNLRWLTITPELAKDHYRHISHLEFFEDMIQYMCSGSSLVVVLEGNDAILTVRQMIGKTKVVESPPGTIRGDYGYHYFENIIHASDSHESVVTEMQRFGV